MDATQLQTIKSSLKLLIAKGQIEKALDLFLETLPAHSSKFNIGVQLSSDFHLLKMQNVKNLTNSDEQQIRTSRINSNLLSLIDMISVDDFEVPSAGKEPKERKKMGHVLYSIPPKMEVQKDILCKVRLAHDEDIILEDMMNGQESHIRSIRKMGKRMEVEIVDPNANQTFEIRNINSKVQPVDKDDFTEWIFFLKPLAEGRFPLFLKVSILTIEDGEKIRKELVLEEIIEVVSELAITEDELGIPVRHSGFMLLPAIDSILIPEAPTPDPIAPTASLFNTIIHSSTFKALTAIAALALIVTFSTNGNLFEKIKTIFSASTTSLSETKSVDTDYDKTQVSKKLLVRPPIKSLNVSPKDLIVKNPTKITSFTLPSGTIITIPANTFVTQEGVIVTKPVKIKYKEFRAAEEIIASGVPMKVLDKEGYDNWMQTAGMFEIRGFDENNVAVKLAKCQEIEINFASDISGLYDSWFFDEVVGNWRRIGSTDDADSRIVTNKNLETEISQLRKRTTNKPQAPRSEDSNRLEFTDLDVRSIPELAGLKSVILIYDGNDSKDAPDNNPWLSDPGRWLKKELVPRDQPRTYQLTLYGDTKYSIPVRLPLQEAEMQLAKAQFQEKLAQYQKDKALLADKENFAKRQRKFMRSMRIANFGFYNHDILWEKDDVLTLDADFNFGDFNEAALKNVMVYLITGDNRVVVSFSMEEWSTFRFSPKSDNKLVALLPGDKAAIFSKKSFQEQLPEMESSPNDNYVFQMEVKEDKIDDIDDISTLLSWADED